MALVLPSTVEELNLLQNHPIGDAVTLCNKLPEPAFENIVTEKRFKREISLPNGVENWNIGDHQFDAYLNFEDNARPVEEPIGSIDDRLVPEEDFQRERAESISSLSSSMDDKQLVFQHRGIKAISTVCADSGSTCITSDHSYVASHSSSFSGLDAEETYQNLDLFLQQVPESSIANTDTMSSISSISSSFNDNPIELTVLQNRFSTFNNNDTFGKKRPLDMSCDDVFEAKEMRRDSLPYNTESRYVDIRRKNNLASKNCRKTRKEKQKEMEMRVTELEKENEGLKVQLQVLEDLIHRHKEQLYSILQKR